MVSWYLDRSGVLTPLFQFAGGGFLIGVGLFLALAIFRPAQSLVITDAVVEWKGVVSRSTIRFDEVKAASLRPDPDASNHQQLVLMSKSGVEMVIHAGFLNPDSDGVIPLIEEGLKREGLCLKHLSS